jgi:hypothetical protein
MIKHHYPQTDEVDKDRLYKLVTVARLMPKVVKEEFFYKLVDYLIAAFAKNLKEDKTNTSWLIFYGESVVGKNGTADLKIILSEGFSGFEQWLTKHYDQDAAEGFLHFCHASYYQRYKENFTESEGSSVLTFDGKALQPAGEFESIEKFCQRSAVLTSLFLCIREFDQNRAKLNF